MTPLPPPTAAPCRECPWRRKAAPGWLGPYTAQEWAAQAHADGPIACHLTIKRDGEWEGASQCAGAAAYRANVCKRPRDPNVAVGPRREDVFSRPDEFISHHSGTLTP